MTDVQMQQFKQRKSKLMVIAAYIIDMLLSLGISFIHIQVQKCRKVFPVLSVRNHFQKP